MCTLTIFPSASGTIVTMNRDEADNRAEAGEHLHTDARGRLQLWWPIDSVSQGTWFGARGDGLIAALLNRYQGVGNTPQRSRGLIIPAVLATAPKDALAAYINNQDWSDFAPFDLVLAHGSEIIQFSWEKGRIRQHSASVEQPYFLSSSSVEYAASLETRREAFEQFIAQHEINPSTVIEQLHQRTHPANPSLGLRMHRPGGRTKSISQAVSSAAGIQHVYIPLQH